MTIYLVRHAQAGTRHDWAGDDLSRPLTKEGRRQAADLVDVFADVDIQQIRSSPFLRCVETVSPLSARRSHGHDRLPVSIDNALAEGPAIAAIGLVRSLIGVDAVLCSHGDIIPAVLDALVRLDGIDLGPMPRCQKGSTWILEADANRHVFTSAQYISPPR
jgi:8-oxo-(d)GTP phosphatase